MNNLKKDLMIVYMFRNGIATFFITLIAFLTDLTMYYQATIGFAFKKIWIDNIYTLMYFLMLWILNYLLFEIYKIVIDTIKHHYEDTCKQFKGIDCITIGSVIIAIVIVVIVFFTVPSILFKTNFCLLLAFMAMRAIKEYMKKRK